MQAYEEVIRTTENPVLAEMFKRIAKQERRHFAYYFNQARDRLADNPRNQRFCKAIVKRFYAPVGQVSHPTGKVEVAGGACGEVPVAYALHPT